VDFFAYPWTRELIEHIAQAKEPHFAGALSALYAGDELVAAHFGMYSERAWHWWFPVYEHAFAKYSPGALLLLRVAEEAAGRGLELLDLGKGDDAYKSSFSNTEIRLAEGCASRPSLGSALRWGRDTGEKLLRALPLGEPVRAALRRVRQWERRRSHS
jgi:CelD/BcsL family acetyltransferase involved in cellulose biosynthesis